VKTKRIQRNLKNLLIISKHAYAQGLHDEEVCINPENHGNSWIFINWRPGLFWLVAPDSEILLKLYYEDGGVIKLEQAQQSLPKDDVIEA
jgi:hypothetical protein